MLIPKENNYRSISLLNTDVKFLIKHLQTKLKDLFDVKEIIYHNQRGFIVVTWGQFNKRKSIDVNVINGFGR